VSQTRNSAARTVALIATVVMLFSELAVIGPLSNRADAGMTWLLEVVDSPASYPTSIAIDSSGNPWILYGHWDGSWSGASLAHWTGSSWTYQNVGQWAVSCLSLALDSLDRPHVVYEYGVSQDMYYAYWNGASWVYELIDSEGNLGSACSIALDSLGRPHVSYEDYTWTAMNPRRDLKYAWRDLLGWHNETVDWKGWGGVSNSIATDSLNRPHIAYHDVDNMTLKHAWWDGSTWNIEIVDPSGEVIPLNPTSIRIDSLDQAHIAYMAGMTLSPGQLRYASWNGVSWTIDPAALIDWINGLDSVSLRLDSTDTPSIAYTNHTGFLSITSKQGSSRVVENVDVGGMIGWGASLALDSSGNPHVSYVDAAYDLLKYAHRGMDSVPPASSVDRIVPYWSSAPRTITATATDGESRVSNVTLWYRSSLDNTSWGLWKAYQRADLPPWYWTFTFPDGEGYYQFYSIAVDTGGNIEPSPPVADAIGGFEQTKPLSVLLPVPSYWFSSTPLTLTATASDAPSGVDRVDLYYNYSGNNASWGAWTLFQTDRSPPWSWSFTFPRSSGWYRLYSIATDGAGNAEVPPAAPDVELGYDASPPMSRVDMIPNGWHRSPIVVTAQATDWYSGVACAELWFRYSTDKVSWSPWTFYAQDASPPWSWSFTFPNGDGFYQFHSIATDNASNSEWFKDWEEANATVDSTPPTATVEQSPPYWKNMSTVLTATVSDATSGVENATLWYRFSSENSTWGAWISFMVDVAPPWSWLFNFPDGPGHYQFQATSFDNASNEDPLGNTHEAEAGFDSDKPYAFMTIGLPNFSNPPTTWVTGSTPLTINAQDIGGSGIAVLKYRIWRGGWSSWSDYSDSFALTGSEGLRFVEFQAFDVAENSGLIENRTLAVDNTPPSTTISPATGDFTIDTVFTLTATDSGSGVRVTRYRVDGGTLTDYSAGFTLPEGDRNISYYSVDNLDNTEEEKWLVVNIQGQPPPNIPPTITLTSPTGGEEFIKGSSHIITWTMHDNEDANANLTIYLNYTSGGTTVSMVAAVKGIESFPWTMPDIEATDVVVNVTVIDSGGMKAWDESGPFTVKAPPPPSEVETNLKPVVAVAFIIVLAVIGVWSSRKKPWKDGTVRNAMEKAFVLTTLPFILAEAMTGIVSLITGQLSIPPLFGAGTIVDLAILVSGLASLAIRLLSKGQRKEKDAESL